MKIVDRCPICGREFHIRYGSPYSSVFMTIKLVEKVLEHVKMEHRNHEDYGEVVKELEDELNHLYEALEEDFWAL